MANNNYTYIMVSPLGNDFLGARNSLTHPFKTLKMALSAALDGDNIYVLGGDYYETPLVSTTPEKLPDLGAAVSLKGKNNIKIQGVGDPIINFTSHGNGFMIHNCNDISITGIKFKGQGLIVDLDYYFALLLLNGSNKRIKINSCSFFDSGNHGIAHLFGPRDSSECVFEYNHFRNGGNMRRSKLTKDGAAIAVGGYKNQYLNNVIERWLRGIELECGDFPGSTAIPTSDIQIIGNRLDECYWQSILLTPNSPGHDKMFERIIIANNIIKGWGINPDAANNWGGNFNHEGIYISGCNGVQILNNNITKMWDGCGIRMESAHGDICYVQASNNKFSEIGRSALITSGLGGKIHRNIFSSNIIGVCEGYPLWLFNLEDSIVKDNLIEKNATYGVLNQKDCVNVDLNNLGLII